MSRKARTASIVLIVVTLAICLIVRTGLAQPPGPAERDGLASLIPSQAIFFLERRGHEAIRPAFLDSNLGQMAQDDAIKQFVHDSRVRIGRMIVAGMFDLKGDEEITLHQKLLHDLLKPFWHNPCAMYVVVDEKFEREPGLGFICIPGEKYRNDCGNALDALMKVGLPPKDKPGRRQAFTHKTGTITWRGVAKDSSDFALSSDPKKLKQELKGKSLFMVNWTLPLLLVATDLSAAEAIESVMAGSGKPKHENPSVQAVMKKTALKDWAFRWHIDVEALMGMVRRQAGQEPMPAVVTALGLDKIRGIGGTGGYADKVYTRMTYVDVPKAAGGLVRIFKAGGSYKPALAMVPSESTFCLAGQLDTQVLLTILRSFTEYVIQRAAHMEIMRQMRAGTTSPAVAQTQPAPGPAATTRRVPKVPEPIAKVFRQLDLLAEASGGHAGIFVTEVQALMMLGGPGGAPLGAVLDVKDRDKALKAVDELVKLAGSEAAAAPADPDEPALGLARPREYRKATIRYVGEMVRLAVLKDRIVIALGDTALKAGIDTAMDSTGGFEPGGKGDRLAGLTGGGSAIFKMDLAALAKLFWPLFMQFAQGEPEEFPFVSMPSTNKMVRMLGPEIAVFAPDAGGLLMKSRGKIPFATKMVVGYPVAGAGLLWMIMH